MTKHRCVPPMRPLTVTVPWAPGAGTPCTCPRPLTTNAPSPLCAWHGVDALHRQANPVLARVGDTPVADVGESWRCAGCGVLWTVDWDHGHRRGGYTAAHAYWRPSSLLERWAGRAITASEAARA